MIYSIYPLTYQGLPSNDFIPLCVQQKNLTMVCYIELYFTHIKPLYLRYAISVKMKEKQALEKCKRYVNNTN